MRIEWHITSNDEECVKTLVNKQRDTVLVRDRVKRNLVENKEQVTKSRLWRTIVCMRLTTQARSGPTGKLATFQNISPFPLRYEALSGQSSRQEFIHKTLRAHSVGRHPTKISKELADNFDRLEKGEWKRALAQCNRLTSLQTRDVEAEVANYIADTLDGFGPKQSRNVLQALGLTRYEIPIDSRVTNWLNKNFEFPFEVTSAALGDRHYYRLVSDAIVQLCERCGEFPCILDAAIFGSSDGEAWSEESLSY